MQNDLFAIVRFKENESRSLAKWSNGRWEKVSGPMDPYFLFGDKDSKIWVLTDKHIEILNDDSWEILPYDRQGLVVFPGPFTRMHVIDGQIFAEGCGKNVPCGLYRYDPLLSSPWN